MKPRCYSYTRKNAAHIDVRVDGLPVGYIEEFYRAGDAQFTFYPNGGTARGPYDSLTEAKEEVEGMFP